MGVNVGNEMEAVLKKSLNPLSVIGWGALWQDAGDPIGQPQSVARINDSAGI
jgi:hypothetical protein